MIDSLEFADSLERSRILSHLSLSNDATLLGPLSERARPDAPDVEKAFCRYLRNIELDDSLPHLKILSISPNAATRALAFDVIARIPEKIRIPILTGLLKCDDPDVQHDILTQMAALDSPIFCEEIERLFESEVPRVMHMAFRIAARNDSMYVAKRITTCLDHSSTDIQAAAIEALSEMKKGRVSQKVVRMLGCDAANVRKSALKYVSRKLGKRAGPLLIPLVNTENDEDNILIIIREIANNGGPVAIESLMSIACRHESQRVKQLANWLIEEYGRPELIKAVRRQIKKGDERIQAFAILLVGKLGLNECAKLIVNFGLCDNATDMARSAALESIGYLADPSLLEQLVPFFYKDNPMERYLAVLSAVKVAGGIENCTAILDVLNDSETDGGFLKQVVLQALIDKTINWDNSHPTVFNTLIKDIRSDNMNIKYLSITALGRSQNLDAVLPLCEIALNDELPEMRSAAASALNELTCGDNSEVLRIVTMDAVKSTVSARLSLFAALHWGSQCNAAAHDYFAAVSDTYDTLTDKESEALVTIARKIFESDRKIAVARIKEHVGRWEQMLSLAWVSEVPATKSESANWKLLLSENDPDVVTAAFERLAEEGASWALDYMMDALLENHGLTDRMAHLKALYKKAVGL